MEKKYELKCRKMDEYRHPCELCCFGNSKGECHCNYEVGRTKLEKEVGNCILHKNCYYIEINKED